MRRGPSFSREGVLDFGEELPASQPFDPDADYARQFRVKTTINTLTVFGTGREPAGLAEPRGPNSGQVWVMAPGRRERRQVRRRIRHANRQTLRENKHLEVQSDLLGPDEAPSRAG